MFIKIIILVLFILSTVLLLTVGSCIAVANTLIYFIPTLTFTDVLTPAAIISTVFMVILGGAIKSFFGTSFPINIDDYEDEEIASPIVSKPRNSRFKR
jgi:hypothetical protein